MNKIKALNQNIDIKSDEVENMIAELMEREEYACTGDACAGKACGIN